MWIRKRANGKYRYEQEYKDPLTDRTRTVSVTRAGCTKADKRQAQIDLDALVAQRMAQAGYGGRREYTLHQLIEAYLLDQRVSVRNSTRTHNQYSLSAVERILGPDTLINRITAPYIREQLLRSGEDAVRMNGRLKHIRALLRWAYRADYIEDVAWLAKLEDFREEQSYLDRIEDKYLEQKELQALLDGMQVERWKLLSTALVLSGLRPGEFYALNNSDVDFKAQEITVSKSYNPTVKEVTLTKTRSSMRTIHMQPELFKAMWAIKHCMERQARNYGYIPRGIFFCDTDGGYCSHFAYTKYFRENTERILGKRYTPYVLRHTHVSLLAAAGVPFDSVARRVGHEGSQITRKVYFHITDKLRERENEELDAVTLLRG